jgi:hypothetical protein
MVAFNTPLRYRDWFQAMTAMGQIRSNVSRGISSSTTRAIVPLPAVAQIELFGIARNLRSAIRAYCRDASSTRKEMLREDAQ